MIQYVWMCVYVCLHTQFSSTNYYYDLHSSVQLTNTVDDTPALKSTLCCAENTFYREDTLQRTHSKETTFYTERTHSEIPALGSTLCCAENTFYRGHILKRTHSIQREHILTYQLWGRRCAAQRTHSKENTFYIERTHSDIPALGSTLCCAGIFWTASIIIGLT